MSAGSGAVKVGYKVRVGPGIRVSSLTHRQGEVLTVTRLASSPKAFWATDVTGETYALYTSEVELVTDDVRIEVGDTAKATHTKGTTVQGVVSYANDVKVKITVPGATGMAVLYEDEGWTFEAVSKAVKPPKVGDPWLEGLNVPIGSVIEFQDKSGTLYLTQRGWTLHTGSCPVAENHIGPATIVYLPESVDA